MINILGNKIVASKPAEPTDYFITEWTVNASDTVTLPLISGGTFNFTVDYGDGSGELTVLAYNDVNASHTYTSSDTYTVKILGTCTDFRFFNLGSKLKITDIKQFGIVEFEKLDFYGCDNLINVTCTDTPILTGTSLYSVFRNCTNLATFSNLDSWDISSINTIQYAFYYCNKFNENVNSWDTSSVTNMSTVFRFCTLFNQPLNSWDVSLVTTMTSMFYGCSNFNQDLSSWNTSSVITMNYTFYNCIVFNQDLSSWSIISATDMTNMFALDTLSTSNYNALLVGFESQAYQPNVTFHGGNSTYTIGSAAETARANMINSDGWIITDGGGI